VFSEQLQNLIRPGDLLLAVSASGNSNPELKAIRLCPLRSAEVVGLLGFARRARPRILVDLAHRRAVK